MDIWKSDTVSLAKFTFFQLVILSLTPRNNAFEVNLPSSQNITIPNITEEVSTIQSFCPLSLCADDGVRGNETNNIHPCYCDDLCSEYKDCCVDKAFSTSKPEAEDRPTHKKKFVCRELSSMYHAYMVETCDESFENSAEESLCVGHASEKRHYFQDIPVTSSNTGITYPNRYCAQCNNDSYYLHKLTAQIMCQPHLNRYQILDDLPALEYVSSSRSWNGTVNGTDYKCYLSIKEYESQINVIRYNKGRTCSEYAEICDRMMRNETHEYTIYKNPHCAIILCSGNFENVRNQTTCYSLAKVPLESPSAFSFSIIFDFRDYNDHADVGHVTRCVKGEVWDPIRRECFVYACAEGEIRIGNNCVEKGFGENNITDNLSCLKIRVLNGSYVYLSNGSVYINVTGEIIPPLNITKINNDDILICTDTLDNSNMYSQKFSDTESLLSMICLSISVLCLFMHIMLFLCLPKRQNLPGKNLCSLSVSLMMAQTLFLFGVEEINTNALCKVIAVSLHFFLLASFFWMNVMSFDVFRTFTAGMKISKHPKTLYYKYSIFAWGLPILVTSLGLITDAVPAAEQISPNYAASFCWISNRKGLLIFFVSPVAVILISNAVFFTLSVLGIQKQGRASKYLKQQIQSAHNSSLGVANTKSAQDLTRLSLYVKLALMMGLSWVFGIVAGLADVPYLWYPFIILNGSQGLFIFIGFDCKREVLKDLFRTFSSVTKTIRTSSSQQTATTSSSI